MWVHWRSADEEARWARRITVVATVVFLLVVCRWRPWELFDRGGFSTDFYDAQARAFWHLRLDVPAAVAGPEGFLIGGKTYLYYGPTLAVARMPFVLLGHGIDGRLSRLSITAGFAVALTATFHLARAVREALALSSAPSPGPSPAPAHSPSPAPRRTSLLIAAVACSPVLYLAGWNSVYDETEMWACALMLCTLVFAVRLWREPSPRLLAVAGAFGVATVLTRASVGFGALAAVALVAATTWRTRPRIALGGIAVAVGGFAVNSVVTFAKVGSWLDLPAARQVLSLQNSDRAAWFAGNGGSFFSTRFLPTTLVQYLRPDAVRIERLVPFIRFPPAAHVFGSYRLEGNTPSSSLPVSATLLVVLAVCGVVLAVRRRAWVPLGLMAAAALAAAPSFLIGFVANRYLTDMVPMLVVPAAVATACMASPARRHAAVAAWGVLVVWGTWTNVALATWTQNLKEPGFTEMRYAIDGAVFGGAPPSVVQLADTPVVPRDGVVAVDGPCDGLYIAEQGHWVALERADGIRQLVGHVTLGDTPLVLVDAGEGTVVLTPSGPAGSRTVVVSYQPVGGEAVTGQPVRVADDHPAIALVADHVAGGLSVVLDGQQALFSFAAPTLEGATIGDAFAPRSGTSSTPICDDLTKASR